MKKFSNLSKSSISASRLAAVSLAAWVKRYYYGHTEELSKETHHEEDIDPREDDLGRGKHLNVIVRTDVYGNTLGLTVPTP